MGQVPALSAALRRRTLLLGAGLLASGCKSPRELQGGFSGVHVERGHLLREGPSGTESATVHRTRVLIAGAGVSGLAAARALRQQGVEDIAVLDLEDQAGGNARSGEIDGIVHPLGAHYLPVPGDHAPLVQHLLEDMGLRRREAGRWVIDERALCHSPQERLYLGGRWQEGLLPMAGVESATLDQYHRFAQQVQAWQRTGAFRMPMRWDANARQVWQRLSMPFASWLDGQGLTDAHLRWYLDYCCRDDYGEGLDQVSAWAGIHYFASRHGFAAPGDGDAPRDQVLTWPGGNGQLSAYLAQPLGGRLHTGQLITRIRPMRSGVEVLAFDVAQRQWSRWECESCVLALPVHVASRVLENSPDWVRIAASQIRHAAWVVANIHLDAPLLDRGPDLDGAAPAWDNVIHGGAGLGYVDARHQSTRPVPGPTVLTWYAALGSSAQAKQGLLQASWRDLASRALDDIGRAHADIRQRATRVNVMRYGHAMAAPNANTMRTVTDLHQRFADGVLRTGRIAMAHSDWSGYSVFEEAYTRGYRAAQALIGVRIG